MSKSPAFQFYPADFLSDGNQLVMELHEAGAYIRLICVCWKEGHLPADLRKLAKMCGATLKQMERIWPALEVCFVPEAPGYITHPRLEKEREKQVEYSEAMQEAGKKGAAKRWAGHKPGHSQATPTPIASDSSSVFSLQSSSSLPLQKPVGSGKKKRRPIPTYSPEFLEAWAAHRRGPKAEAFEEYAVALESGAERATILRGLKAYVRELKPGFEGEHLFRWLRDRRWEAYTDTLPAPTPPPRPAPEPAPEPLTPEEITRRKEAIDKALGQRPTRTPYPTNTIDWSAALPPESAVRQ